jgi:5-methylcytosine-specific restriction protein A
MPGHWVGATPRNLPPNWPTITKHIHARDGHRCTAQRRDGTRCPAPSTDIDHIGSRDNHTPANLQALCAWHHARKTAQQGNTARRPVTTRRPPEQHPGLT